MTAGGGAMSELEEKLGAILSNQDAMSQIMALAQSLGGSSGQGDSPAPQPAAQEGSETDAAPPAGAGGLDPRLLTLAARLAAEYNSDDDQRAALLSALRPFVRPQRYAKLDKAIQISKLTRVIRIALDSFRKKGEESHV